MNLVKPFDKLNIIKEKGSIGKCWVFHMNNKGELKGFFFPSGYRILNVQPYDITKEEFYLENRNLSTENCGLLSALIPSKPLVGSVHDCELIVINKICYESSGRFIMNYYKWDYKRGMINAPNLLRTGNDLEQHFTTNWKIATDMVNVRYMNSFHGLTISNKGIQMKYDGPDIVKIKYLHVGKELSLHAIIRKDSLSNHQKKKHKHQMQSNKSEIDLTNRTIHIVLKRKNLLLHQVSGKNVYQVIPYKINDNCVIFCYLTKEQFKDLMDKFKTKGKGIDETTYCQHLDQYSMQNKKPMVKVILLKEKYESSGNMICICPSITLLPVTTYNLHEDINGIYVMKSKSKQTGFELSNNLITIF